MSDTKEFVDGLIVKAPRDGAPDFVKASISIKRKDLGNWLRSKDDEWINIDVKESKGGKYYAEVNNWKPSQEQRDDLKQAAQGEKTPAQELDDFGDDVPF